MSVIAKLTGQVLGMAPNSPAPYTQITLSPNASGGNQVPLVFTTLSPSVVASLLVGQNVNIYLAGSPTDITAIESAVTVVSIDSQT